MNEDLTALYNINLWCSLSVDEQDNIISTIKKLLEKEFEYLFTRSYTSNPAFRIPTFKHIPSKVEMNLIIGGSFEMGFSQQEENQALKTSDPLPFNANEMRPVHSVTVKPFLMGRFPILETFAVDYVEIDEDLFRPEFGDFGEQIPIYLTQEELNVLLNEFDFNISSEAQWEYAYRGRTNMLFYWGESLPSDNVLETQILLFNFEDEATNLKAANPFGLVGMQVGEWCSDIYAENYNTAHPRIDVSYQAVRGGAAALYPWQDETEWALCISAMRRSSEELEDGTCGARFVKSLEL